MSSTETRARTKHEALTRTLQLLAAGLEPGERFPSQSELMRRYQVSDRTVLRSLDELSRAGWLVRRRGSGTFVAHPDTGTTAEPLSELSTIAALALTCTPSRFYQNCLDVLSVQVERCGWSLIAQHARRETGYAEVLPMEAMNPRGFIALSYLLHPIARRLLDRGRRTVIVGAPPVDAYPSVPCISGDHEHGGYLAARYLLNLGHRRIAFARFEASTPLQQTYRWRGHLRAQRDAAVEGLRVEWRLLDGELLEAWRSEPEAAGEYFRRPEAPTAIVAWNDSEADILLRICHAAGIRVPEDLSVIGYDALPGTDHSHPPLTTVDQHVSTQLRFALDFLSRPEPPPPTQSVIVLPTLIERASCAPPKRQ